MEFALQTEAPPLVRDSSGALRIGQSRVLLELVIRAFQDGATPEAIAQRYSTASLADVYTVIAYYLRHRADIDTYLAEREEHAEQVRRHIQGQEHRLANLRTRLVMGRSRKWKRWTGW